LVTESDLEEASFLPVGYTNDVILLPAGLQKLFFSDWEIMEVKKQGVVKVSFGDSLFETWSFAFFIHLHL